MKDGRFEPGDRVRCTGSYTSQFGVGTVLGIINTGPNIDPPLSNLHYLIEFDRVAPGLHNGSVQSSDGTRLTGKDNRCQYVGLDFDRYEDRLIAVDSWEADVQDYINRELRDYA